MGPQYKEFQKRKIPRFQKYLAVKRFSGYSFLLTKSLEYVKLRIKLSISSPAPAEEPC